MFGCEVSSDAYTGNLNDDTSLKIFRSNCGAKDSNGHRGFFNPHNTTGYGEQVCFKCIASETRSGSHRIDEWRTFYILIFVFAGLFFTKEFLKLALLARALLSKTTSVHARDLCGTSLLAPLLITRRGFLQFEEEVVLHTMGWKEAWRVLVVEGLCENLPQLILGVYYLMVVTSEGMGPWGVVSISITGLSLAKLLATAVHRTCMRETMEMKHNAAVLAGVKARWWLNMIRLKRKTKVAPEVESSKGEQGPAPLL